MIHCITLHDLNDPALEIYRMPEVQLRRYFEPAEGLFIAESPKVIGRALDAGYVPVSMLIGREDAETAALLCRCGNIPVYTAEEALLTQLTGYHLTRGALCAMRRKPLPSAEELCAGKHRIAVLENVVNPTNVGAILRSAAAMQIEAVLLTPGCSDPLYRRAARVSMGTVFQVPWTYLPDCTDIALLHRMGFAAAALALREDAVSITDAALRQEPRLAVILGTEGEGLCDTTIREADYTVIIPMAKGVDSLNVAAASAVAFWELNRT
ncbi:MAG: RNA methyltransferase [Oscillospiraceae bacterium]|nr:RNA methyltransferase [Oscillospiraceae bacterium]